MKDEIKTIPVNIKRKIETLLAKHQIRLVSFKEFQDEFDDTIYEVHPHFKDFTNADIDQVLDDLATAFNLRVVYAIDGNRILLKK